VSILTPTKDKGATALPNDVLYADPAAEVTEDSLRSQLAAVQGVDPVFLADVLSGYLQHERCGTHLYRSVAGRTANPVLKAKFEEFGAQTRRHVEILETLIGAAGGNPAFVSPMARASEAMDTKLLESTFLGSGALDPLTADMAMLDAVFIAESVDHANWEAMGKIAQQLDEGELRTAFEEAVGVVEAQEDEHLGWARDMRTKMTMLQLDASLVAKGMAKAEELVARLKG
jgi:rubrerythrin